MSGVVNRSHIRVRVRDRAGRAAWTGQGRGCG